MIEVVDIADECPRHGPRRRRDVRRIKYLIVHHSGAEGKPGAEGAIRSASYLVEQAKKTEKATGRRWPYPSGPAYHYWISADKNSLIYRTNPDFEWSMHSNLLNEFGLAVCLQGNHGLQADRAAQYENLLLLLTDLTTDYRFSPDHIVGHCEIGKFGAKAKPSCPGKRPMELVAKFRDSLRNA